MKQTILTLLSILCINIVYGQSLKKNEVKVPSFTLDLQVSPEIAKILKAKKEQIVVSVMLHGEPKKQVAAAARKYLGDHGASLYLGEFEYKLSKAGKLVIANKRVPQIAFENLKSSNYLVDVNVFSSRKTYKTNIFSTNHVGGYINEIGNKTHKIYIKMLR